MPQRKTGPDHARLDRVVAEARRASDERASGYRERALKMYPWICGRCSREFTHANLQLLEVHHRDHNHDNNPPDGSNWELLCTYCHENEHQRMLTEQGRAPDGRGTAGPAAATHQPFAALRTLIKTKDPT